MTQPAICPVCWHWEELRVRRNGGEPCHDDPAVMRWNRPYGGARGQQVTRMDGGFWKCEICQVALTPHEAGVLLDAVLVLSSPPDDSIVDGVHMGARQAFEGGPT